MHEGEAVFAAIPFYNKYKTDRQVMLPIVAETGAGQSHGWLLVDPLAWGVLL